MERKASDSQWTAVREVGPITAPVFRIVGNLPESIWWFASHMPDRNAHVFTSGYATDKLRRTT